MAIQGEFHPVPLRRGLVRFRTPVLCRDTSGTQVTRNCTYIPPRGSG